MTRTRAAAATAGHDSSILISTAHNGLKAASASPRHSARPVTDLDHRPLTMASARKSKGRQSSTASQAAFSNGSTAQDSTASSSNTPLPTVDPSPATSKGTRPARSSSRRHAPNHPKDAMEEDTQAPIQLHDVPDNVMQAQGLASISTSLIDSLPERSFPKKGISLHPGDQNDPLLILCGKVLASVSNRALTPKEIALILARRHGWQFAGSQPFAVVSSCIRSHVRRANLAIPPYNPIFTPYELSSIPPAEDIPCLGIEADSKPVVNRGTFWFLSESMGYGYPFPHRRVPATTNIATPTNPHQPIQASSSSSTSSPHNNQPIAPAPPQPQHRRSSSRHQPQSMPLTQPIPIMPAPPQPIASSTSTPSLPTLAPNATDRLTRAQMKSAQSTSSGGEEQVAATGLSYSSSAPVDSNMSILSKNSAANGKRKRTISKATSRQGNQAHSAALASNDATSYPHLQQLPAGASAAIQLNAQPGVQSGNKKSSSKRAGQSSAAHRRAFSSCAGDGVSSKPIPALRKLKLRLSAVSESAVLDSTSSSSSPSTAKKVTLLGKSTSSSTKKQPKSKRARTQSMSHQTNTTASFPFDDLHLYHSMQQQQPQQPNSLLHNNTSFHNLNSEGTLYPFEMHMQLPHSSSSPNGVDLLLTSRSAPEGGNLFSPALAAAAHAQAQQHVAGPFSRSHSPSSSMHHYRHHRSGRRSLPPASEEYDEIIGAPPELEYDGWGMEFDHIHDGNSHSTRILLKEDNDEDEEDSFHEAMLKNDDIDFEFDFSLGSLGQSASRFSVHNPDESNLSLEEVEEEEEDEDDVDEKDTNHEEGKGSTTTIATAGGDGKETGLRRSMSILESLAVDAVMDGLNNEEEEDHEEGEKSHDTLRDLSSSKKKRPLLRKSGRKSSVSADVDSSSMEEDDKMVSEEEEEEEEEDEESQVKEEDSTSSTSRIALLERRAFERALNTTLCPAASKLGEGSSKPARLLAKRMNSSSSLNFSRMTPSIPTSDLPVDPTSSSSPINTSATSITHSLLRPASVSRTNSRDVLSSAVPLAELPSIPLEDNRRDSFLFYHLTSDADPPSYFNDAFKTSSPPRIDGKENHNNSTAKNEGDRDDDMSDAASSSSSFATSSSSSLLTRIVKSEEELDEMVDLDEDDDADEGHDNITTTTTNSRRDTSRCCSTASAISRAEIESNDSFNPEMIYPIIGGSNRRAPSADLGKIGGQGELLDDISQVQQHTSRSQSSSRTTSLSPRDSFSPPMIHHGTGSYSSEVEADWALTPPSEEEHVDEDEKNLDRATMLGLESVGMDDLDDVWPGVRRSLGSGNATGRIGNNIEVQVDGVTSGFKGMEVFEPVLSAAPAAPIPQGEIPSPILFSLSMTNKIGDGQDADDTVTMMEIDPTPMDEHTAAAMFIADESLHPPKPAPILTVTVASESEDANAPQPSLSPVSAATRDVTNTADVHAPTSSAVNALQQNSAASDSMDRDSTTPVQQQGQSQQHSQHPQQPASTQSFLFYPEKPFHPEISILLTDTKILFYSTIVNIPRDGRPLLRRVDNDAVDAEALLLSLEGLGGLDSDRIETLRKIKELGNTWVSLDFARELLSKYGGTDPLLGIFLADDILLAWNEKLVKLGSMLRQKNGLPTPVAGKNEEKSKNVKIQKEVSSSLSASTSPTLTEKAIQSKKSSKADTIKEKEELEEATGARNEDTLVPIKSKKEVEITPTVTSSSPPKNEKLAKSKLARRASSRIKGT